MRSTATIIPLRQPPFSGELPRKPKNKHVRSREYLTEKEVEALMNAARKVGRHGHRDATLILLAYRPWPAGQSSNSEMRVWVSGLASSGLASIADVRSPSCMRRLLGAYWEAKVSTSSETDISVINAAFVAPPR